MDAGNTIDAIYQMRQAAEEKARAEIYATLQNTPDSRNQLLAASLDLEAKTQDAIEACTEGGDCDHAPDGESRGAVVIDLDAARKKNGS